jgi:succinate dehydrogenase / fumarate reductase, cytochrome b subunit
VAEQRFLDKHDFLLRRLHSLTGIVPIGVFLIAHLVTNSSIVWGSFALREHRDKYPGLQDGGTAYFHKEVTWINEQIPHLLLIEITLWLSIAFHSIYGFYIATTGKSNVKNYGYAGNWRYSLQRISGYVGILFIFYHIATLRWGWSFLVPGGAKWSYEASASTLAAALRGSTEEFTALGLLVSSWYFIGVTLLVFHFANGLWTAAITWGITISRAAQRRWGYVCAALGAGLMVAGWAAVIGFAILPPAKANKIENKVNSHSSSLVVPESGTSSASARPLVP